MAKVPTLCEVSYDLTLDSDEKFYTPFRLPSGNRSKYRNFGYYGGRSSVPLVDQRRQSFACVGVLKSVENAQDTYYEYLRDYYIEHSSSPLTFYSGRTSTSRGGTVPSPQLPPRPYSTVPTLPDSNYIAPIHYDSNPITHPLSLPALSKLHHGEESPEASPYDDEKLIWVDTLNAWVSEKKLKESKPYVSFINNPPYVEKLFTATEGRKMKKCLKCHRYEDHMYNYKSKLSACSCRRQPNLQRHRQAILDRRDKLRSESPSKRAQRKAYSTPLYNTHAQRKVKFTPLSARYNYEPRNIPSPASPVPSSKDVKIVEGDSHKNVSFKDEKEEHSKDKLTEVFGVDTHSSESDADKSEVKKEAPKLFVRRHQKPPVPVKDSSKQQLPKIPPKEEVLVKKTPPKKPVPEPIPIDYDEIREATARLMRKSVHISLYIKKEKDKAAKVRPAAPPPPPKTRDKLWKAGPKFELKSPKSKKPGLSLRKKQGSEFIKPQPLPVSLPEDLAVTPPPGSPPGSPPTIPIDQSIDTQTDLQPATPPVSDSQSVDDGEDEEQKSKKSRSPIKKKERVIRDRHEDVVEGLPEGPDLSLRKQSSWIYGSNSGSEIDDHTRSTHKSIIFNPSALPTTPDVPSLIIDKKKRPLKTHVINKKLTPVSDNKKRWGAKKCDTSYEDEQRRAELAERRRKKQMLMYEKLKLSKMLNEEKTDENGKNGASFDDYDFLSKYCIFATTKKDMLQHAFNLIDDKGTGWIDCAGTMAALRSVNNKLTSTEEKYLYRVMELTGYNVSHGADFKLFSILAALSTKITLLDEWMKNLIGQMDFKTLEMKLFLCKTLWECNVNGDTNTIPIEQLMIELRAGGVSYQHECQVRKKLSHLKALDLFDFLTYVPLFIMIHESVVDNPLDDSRIK